MPHTIDTQQSKTDLFYAATRGDLANVDRLVQSGADLDSPGKFNQTALASAALNGHTEIVELLAFAGANLEAPDDTNHTALDTAIEGALFKIPYGKKITEENILQAIKILGIPVITETHIATARTLLNIPDDAKWRPKKILAALNNKYADIISARQFLKISDETPMSMENTFIAFKKKNMHLACQLLKHGALIRNDLTFDLFLSSLKTSNLLKEKILCSGIHQRQQGHHIKAQESYKALFIKDRPHHNRMLRAYILGEAFSGPDERLIYQNRALHEERVHAFFSHAIAKTKSARQKPAVFPVTQAPSSPPFSSNASILFPMIEEKSNGKTHVSSRRNPTKENNTQTSYRHLSLGNRTTN